MWTSSIEKECNSSQVYCQAKGWFQKSQEFSNDLEKSFWSGKIEGEKMDSHKKVLKMFSPLKILNSPFSKERDFWSFSFSLFFYASFCLFFSMLRLFIEDELRDLWNVWGENKFFSNFLSNGMEVATLRFMKLGELWKNYRWWMHTPEWTYARQ
jgi:hypothetical protein